MRYSEGVIWPAHARRAARVLAAPTAGRLGAVALWSAVGVGALSGCARSQGMELANTPAYGRPPTCPESPAQFMQPGTSHLDPFSPDAARCSYEAPASSAPAQLRGSVQERGPASAPALGVGVEGVHVELYDEGTSAITFESAAPLGRAKTDASGAYFLTAPIKEAGEYLLVVHRGDEGPPLATKVIRAKPGSQTVPAVVLAPESPPAPETEPGPPPTPSSPL